MAKQWYILHTYSGYEKRVQGSIEKQLKSSDLAKYIGEVKIPIENTVEMYQGKKRNVQRKFFPGYLLIEMDLVDPPDWRIVCREITSMQGVSGFIGTKNKTEKPIPISHDEAKDILQRMGEIKTSESFMPKVSYTFGETVKVIDGPFNDFHGVIEDINYDKGKLKVRVEIFGRSTPVELEFLQVESM